MTPQDALDQLQALADPARAADMAAYHKAPRPYLGISVPDITALATSWREGTDTAQRVAIADHLWQSNIHEARIAAAKLLTQARIKDDERGLAPRSPPGSRTLTPGPSRTMPATPGGAA